jgi:hypothetical protein
MARQPKPTPRPDPIATVDIAREAIGLQAEKTEPAPVAAAKRRSEAPAEVQFGMRVSKEMARALVASVTKHGGSLRSLIAHYLKNDGYNIPEDDLHPRQNKRTF